MTRSAPRAGVTPLRLAVLGSLALHAAAALYFFSPPRSEPSVDAHGTVSVDFVEPVVHRPAAAVGRARDHGSIKKRKRLAPNAPDAKRDEAPGADEGDAASDPSPTGSAGTPSGAALDQFTAQVTRAIDARKVYPAVALRREFEGRVVVAITLERDGRLRASDVEAPCPYEALNAAALRAVRDVAHFPPLPTGSGETMHLHVPIVFRISRGSR